jgi:hypothetical protein
VEGVYYVPVHRKDNKTDCNNYHGISLLSTSYKILSDILLSRLDLYIDEITGDHQCGFRHNRSTTTDQLLAYADDVNLLEEYINSIKKNTETLIMLVRRLV